MKKIQTIVIITLFITAFLLPALVLADTESAGPIGSLLDQTAGAQGAGYDTSGDSSTGLATLLGYVVRVFLSLLGVIFISYTVYGGFLWMTSAGNDEQIKKGKKVITNGVIGLVVVLAAASIYVFLTIALVGLRPGVDLSGV
ncbi:MAG: hypothetical protein WC508_04355 [Patescibacteria group bacterium]